MANHKGPLASPDPINDGLPDDDIELVSDDLRRMYRLEALAHAPSLERVYARLQAIERSGTPLSPEESSRLSVLPPTSPWKGAHALKTSMSIAHSPNTQAAPTPRRLAPLAPSRLTRVAAVLATGLLLTGALLGFLYFRGQRSASPAPTLTASLRCHSATAPATPYASPPDEHPPYPYRDQEVLDWSARGEIMYPMGQAGQTFFDASTCAMVPVAFKPPAPPDYPGLQSGGPFSGLWSPDGTRLLLLLEFDEPPYFEPPAILDATTGRLLASLQMSPNSVISRLTPQIGQAVWSADGTQIITLTAFGSTTASGITREGVSPYKVQVWDSRTGALLRTGLGFSLLNLFFDRAWLSPDGAYVAVRLFDHRIQFWGTTTGQLVSTTPPLATGYGGTVAWSPDGSYFAFGISSASPSVTPGQVQIWSRATGQLVATLTDTDTYQGYIMGLAWSPSGRYLAETSEQITIWDTTTWQQVATFGNVQTSTPDSAYYYPTVTWSPDGSRLASMREWVQINPTTPAQPLVTSSSYSQMEVWQLSSASGTTSPGAPPTLTSTVTPTTSGTPTAAPTRPVTTPTH